MRTLEVKNFGPITHAKIEIRKFNLFIGEQSIGKSTIAKLITIFTDYMNLFFYAAMGDLAWELTLGTYDLQVYAKKSYSIKYAEHIGDTDIVINIKDGVIKSSVKRANKIIRGKEGLFRVILENKPLFHEDSMVALNNLPANQENVPTFLNFMQNSLYVPAERIIAAQMSKLLPIITMGKEQLPVNLLRYLSELNNAKAKYTELRLDLLNVSYTKKDDEDFVVLNNKDELPLKFASSGIQSALPLLLVLLYGAANKEYASFVVEEPECNLFPQKQMELLQLLIRQIYSQDRMLTITTHSPYLLSALNNYLYAGRIAQELPESTEELVEIMSKDLWLESSNCSIYSLGETINGGKYCLDLVDSTTGMIDFNYLDGVSLTMSEEFGKLNNLFIKHQRAKRRM